MLHNEGGFKIILNFSSSSLFPFLGGCEGQGTHSIQSWTHGPSPLCFFLSKIVASRVLAHIFQKYFEHSWFRVFAHCICFFTSPFFRSPSSFGPLSRPLAGGCPTLSPIRPLSHHRLGKTPSRRMRENVRICQDLIYPLIPVVGMQRFTNKIFAH